MWDPTRLSLLVLMVAVPTMFVVGLGLALLFSRTQFRGKVLAEAVVLLPLVLPPSVVGYVLLRFLGRGGPILEWFGINLLFTWQAAAIASAVVGLPLMVQTARVGLQAVDSAVEEAAKVDGAGRLRVLLTVTMPLARNGILAGLTLATVRALGEFGATLAVAGSIPGRTQTMPLAVYDAMQRSDYRLANLLSGAMIAIGFTTIFAIRKLSGEGQFR